jgi:hypothetical protein
MPTRTPSSVFSVFRSAALALALSVLVVVGLAGAGCSRHDADEAPDGGDDLLGPEVDAGRRSHVDAGDAAVDAAHDARAEQEQAAIADAGRFCGERDRPDCPLQGWMKLNAKVMVAFGDTTSLAEVMDRIADFAPTNTTEDGGLVYANWVSIAHDGASASRVGNLNAARAACRGCHREYRMPYHERLRGRPLPDVAALAAERAARTTLDAGP